MRAGSRSDTRCAVIGEAPAARRARSRARARERPTATGRSAWFRMAGRPAMTSPRALPGGLLKVDPLAGATREMNEVMDGVGHPGAAARPIHYARRDQGDARRIAFGHAMRCHRGGARRAAGALPGARPGAPDSDRPVRLVPNGGQTGDDIAARPAGSPAQGRTFGRRHQPGECDDGWDWSSARCFRRRRVWAAGFPGKRGPGRILLRTLRTGQGEARISSARRPLAAARPQKRAPCRTACGAPHRRPSRCRRPRRSRPSDDR
jgi:hypothetical protein